MKRRQFAGSLAGAALQAAAFQTASRPNILLILADDLGWADLGCYGSRFHETPNLDRLARQGVRFTQAYSAGAVCSPTRASIMTGCYPPRAGITDYLPGLPSTGRKLKAPDDLDQLPLEETTVAEALRATGYETFYGGKWHLGGRGFEPPQQGFLHYTPDEGGPKNIANAARYTAGFREFMDARDKAKPFFAMLSYNEVHTPIIPRERWMESYNRKVAALPPIEEQFKRERNGLTRVRQDNAAYASMLATLDDEVGQVLSRLESSGAASNTAVFFLSDNGGLSTLAKGGPTSNAPLRAGKGWLYEGGIRIPMIVRAPGITRPGTESSTPVITIDLYPTMLALAGAAKPPGRVLDGVDVSAVLSGKQTAVPRKLYWHYPHYHGSTWAPGGAMRDGDWKWIEFFDEESAELYDLRSDLGERRNLAASRPEVAARMREDLRAWRQRVGARMPTPQTAG